jgi:steroid delta-isomerase-like uncharacterized protein
MAIAVCFSEERMLDRPLQPLWDWSHDWLAAWNSHVVEQVLSLCAPSYVGRDISQASSHQGHEGVRDYVGSYLRAFPDLELTADETIVQPDRLALAWTARGTHRGTLMNIPSTGRAVRVRGVSILMVQDGLLSRALYMWDVAGLLRELGLLPDL